MSELIHFNIIGFAVLGYFLGFAVFLAAWDLIFSWRFEFIAAAFILLVPTVSLMSFGHYLYYGDDWESFLSAASNLGWYIIFATLIGESFFKKSNTLHSADAVKAQPLMEPYEPPPFGGR